MARYINHSCRPNAKPVGRRGGIVIVALRLLPLCSMPQKESSSSQEKSPPQMDQINWMFEASLRLAVIISLPIIGSLAFGECSIGQM